MHTSTRCPTTAAIRRLFTVAGVALLAMLLASCERRQGSSSAADSTQLNRAVVPEPARGNVPIANAALDYIPPGDSVIRNGALGVSIRRGLALIMHTTDSLPSLAPGGIQCASCHLDAGRRRDAASLIGVTARYPRYMDRAGHAREQLHDLALRLSDTPRAARVRGALRGAAREPQRRHPVAQPLGQRQPCARRRIHRVRRDR